MGLVQPWLHDLLYFVVGLAELFYFEEGFVEVTILQFVVGYIQFTQLTNANVLIDVGSIGFRNTAQKRQLNKTHAASPNVLPKRILWRQYFKL